MVGKGNLAGKSGRKQPGFWESLPVDPVPGIKTAMHEVMHGHPLSREQVVDGMNRLAHLAGLTERVSLAALDKWLAPNSLAHYPRWRALNWFCQVTGSNRPLEVYVMAFPGVRLASEEDWELLMWAKSEKAVREAKKEAKRRAMRAGVE